MVNTSRKRKSVFIIPLFLSLALEPARGFQVTGEVDDADITVPVSLSSNPEDAENIIINGTQGSEGVALNLDDDRAVTVNGLIIIRDRSSMADDAETYDLNQAVGVKITTPFTGTNLSFETGFNIDISEILGPQNNDADNDGIIEGSPSIGTAQRIGLWVDEAITGSLIGKGGFIRIDGNNARGVQVDDPISENFDFSTAVHDGQFGGISGDDAVGVEINANIDGYYRQRGDIDVRGEGSVGIKVDASATVGNGMMLDAGVNATGYSLIVAGSGGGPDHGRDESDLEAAEVNANSNERRRGSAAVDIAGNLPGGLIIGGKVNQVLTSAEASTLNNITIGLTDDEGNRVDISPDGSDLRSTPVDFDGNRPLNTAVRLTSYGEDDNEATVKIAGDVGDSINGGSAEILLDVLNDDGDGDIYTRGTSGLKQFFYSYGLMNRGTISADGLYDGYKADAILFNGNATVYGGFYSSGSISAVAYNQNATAIKFDEVSLTDGLRNDGSVFQNDGTVLASISTHAGADESKTKGSDTATAILLTEDVLFNVSGTPNFVNRGAIDSAARFFNSVGNQEDGTNAVAFDFSEYSGAVKITQELLKDDALLTPGNANTAENPYRGNGDLDIDANGDGLIDTRDVNAPRIIGNVKFGDGDNELNVRTGTVVGDISFGDGDDALILLNEIADDTVDNYTAPLAEVTGRITNGNIGNLDISIGERTRLNLIGQEGDLETETENLSIDALTLNGELLVVVDHEQLSAGTPLLSVTDLTLGNGAKITPRLTGLPENINEETTVDIISYGNQVTLPGTILNNETPFIYNVALKNENGTISANFNLKSVSELGLNRSEGSAFNAVLAHFRSNKNLESAINGIYDGDDFRTDYRHLLPHYSDGTAQQLSGLADIATGAVSQHLQLIKAGGRRGGDGWVQQFGDYRKQDSSIDGATVSGTSYAIALGYDLPVSIIDALGFYVQMGFSAVNEKSAATNEITSDGISYGAYLSDKIGPVQYELNAAHGFIGLESDRLVSFAGLVDRLTASWDATSTAASVRLAYPILEASHLLRFEMGADFFRLEHDDYSESEAVGHGFAMQIKGGESEKTSQFIGLRGGYRRGGGDPVAVVWEPNYYLGWRTTSDTSPYKAKANFVGTDESFILESYIESEDSVDLGVGLAAHNDYFAVELNYRARFADGEQRHGGGVSVRVLF